MAATDLRLKPAASLRGSLADCPSSVLLPVAAVPPHPPSSRTVSTALEAFCTFAKTV